ncbi:MAG: hypothetical protein H8M99_12090 [Gloeobacteraceae cyanobacterium ES-bin-144]|nr:hypothetical protein [Verrucomicrobiales bacterium]
MKTKSLLLMLVSSFTALAQVPIPLPTDEQLPPVYARVAAPPAEAKPNTARVIGKLPDGTPPPPEPPKPGFFVPNSEVLSSKTHREGGRNITVREIQPITLPPPPAPPPQIDRENPIVKQRIAEIRARIQNTKNTLNTISLGANIYHSVVHSPRSLVSYWPQHLQVEGERLETVTFWSSADFALLTSVPKFVDAHDNPCMMFLMWSVYDIDRTTSLFARHGRKYNPPAIPEFAPGKATYQIVSGNPDAKSLADIQAVHDLYNNEFEKLSAAYASRERARREREEWDKAHPQKPKDITLNYWRIDAPITNKNTKGQTK